MASGRPAQADEFREAMSPLVNKMREFANAVSTVGERHGNMATAASPAMREIADEAGYVAASGDWTGPITDTHSLGALTLWATADYVRTFAEAFTADRPPVWGHLVIARSAWSHPLPHGGSLSLGSRAMIA
jgi:hypothetical protein